MKPYSKNSKKTVHIVYPFDLKKKINPWSIGNNIFFALKKDFNTKVYNWTSIGKIIPSKGDILIGHANSNPYTIFRRSLMHKNWAKKILIQPYNEDPLQMSYLYDVVPKCDLFFAICGSYWFKRIGKSKFRSWKNKMIQIDLGLHFEKYPFLKKNFNKKKERKFIYIGNDYSYNNFAKNLKYLKKISHKVGVEKFSTIGNKSIEGVKHYGWLNFEISKSLKIIKNYDFLIQTSKFDANPTTVLEAMSWGLIPVITKECGYSNSKSIINIPLNNYLKAVKIINSLQIIDSKLLINYQKKNIKNLKKIYNWTIFKKKIRSLVLYNNKSRNIRYRQSELNFFIKNTKNSPNYYLNLEMIFLILKSNIKILIQKFF